MECHDILSGSPLQSWLTRYMGVVVWNDSVIIFLTFSYSMSRITSTMTISLPEDLKQFAIKRSRTAHFGTPSDYIRGLIREDLQRLEQERLEIELMKGLKGKGIPMTNAAWKRMREEAAKIIQSKRIRAKTSTVSR